MSKRLATTLGSIILGSALLTSPYELSAQEIKLGDKMPEPRGKLYIEMNCKFNLVSEIPSAKIQIYDVGDNDYGTVDIVMEMGDTKMVERSGEGVAYFGEKGIVKQITKPEPMGISKSKALEKLSKTISCDKIEI